MNQMRRIQTVFFIAFVAFMSVGVAVDGATAQLGAVRLDEVVACDGSTLTVLVRGRPTCLMQSIDASSLPVRIEDISVANLVVTLDGNVQPLRGEPTVDAEGSALVFSIIPTATSSGTITVTITLEPKNRVFAGYYDVPAWYEVSIEWPTFFGASQMRDEEHDEVDATVEFTPFPCTWFLGEELCNSTSFWLSA